MVETRLQTGTDVLVALISHLPRYAKLEYLSLFTNVYYSEMLDQYQLVCMIVDRRTMLPALNI